MGLPATKSYEYEHRRPEETPLYEILRTQINTFASDREIENRTLPDYVNKELEAFLYALSSTSIPPYCKLFFIDGSSSFYNSKYQRTII